MEKSSIKSTFKVVFCLAILVIGGLYLGLTIARKAGQHWDKTPVTIIVQTGPQRQALQTTYLAELMQLSAEIPIFSNQFDVKKAASALLNSPVIKEAKVSFLRPGVLYVDYAVRQPIALLADYENAAIDAEGRIFPLSPFFSPKNLPEIYLGLEEEFHWNASIKGKGLDLACELLTLFRSTETELFFLRRLDVSRIEEKSLGKKEIAVLVEDVIVCKEGRLIVPRYIRLNGKNYRESIRNYWKLRTHLIENERKEAVSFKEGQTLLYGNFKVIDLRLPKMALIDATN